MIVYRGSVFCQNCGRSPRRDERPNDDECCVFAFTPDCDEIDVDLSGKIHPSEAGDHEQPGVPRMVTNVEATVDGKRFTLTDEELEQAALDILESQD